MNCEADVLQALYLGYGKWRLFMAIETKVTCDRCQVLIRTEGRAIRIMTDRLPRPADTVDLCPECCEAFRVWCHGQPISKVEPQAVFSGTSNSVQWNDLP